jgi:PBP1b-binding outer membrane lipoprotein LpoB
VNKTVILAVAAAALASCSKEQKTEAPKPEAPKGHFTISAPPMPKEPAALAETQRSMVESMIADPRIPLEVIEGEAYRRKVKLTPEQIERKKAQNVQAPGAPAAPAAPAQTPTAN